MKRKKSSRGIITALPAGLGILFLFSILLFSANPLPLAETAGKIPDLTAIFANQLVKDTNNDTLPDDIAVRFLIDTHTTAPDIEAAAAIAARLGFESCAMDPDLCVSTRAEARKKRIEWLIIFTALKNKQPGKKERAVPAAHDGTNSKEDCGIEVYREKGINVIDIFGATAAGRKYAAVNFFARFPYIWDITGRETGELWFHLKEHILLQLPQPGREKAGVRVRAVHYRYRKPLEESSRQRRLEQLGLSGTMQKKGEVEKVVVELELPVPAKDTIKSLENLVAGHKGGEKTGMLNYAGVKNVVIHILSEDGEKREKTITIPRTAVPQRFLNPATDPDFFRKKVTITDSQADIAGFYGNTGIYKDIDGDGFADRMVSRIIYDGELPVNAIDMAARIGLEDCTVSLPFTIPAGDLDMKSIRNLERPVLIGSHNRFSAYLEKIGKAKTPQLQPGDGFIRFSPGFNPGGAYIISGSNSEGENAALQYVAAVLPYISASHTRAGAPVWQDLSREVELFFSRKNDAGQAAYGILQIDKQKNAFAAPDLEEAKVRLFTMRRIPNLDVFINKRNKQKFCGGPGGDFSKEPPGRRRPETDKSSIKVGGRLEAAGGFSDTFEPRWEVDEFREIFNQKILPKLRTPAIEKTTPASPSLFIDLRLSEPNEVLKQQKAWLESQLTAAGFPKEIVRIRAITAYKQGFHWIKDHIIPRLKAGSPAAIQIRFAPFLLDLEETRKYRPEPVRWLQELYPVDEILKRELNIPLEAIRFVKDDTLQDAVYEFSATNRAGEVLYKETFTPFTTEIPFQSRFTKWGNVVVCTGGVRAEWQGREIFSTAIDTDPLRLWRHYQEKILPRLTRMIEKQAGGQPKLENQPFFDKLQINVWMSEPDYRLGLDEELVSSLESFHEDVYFNTLDYFQGLVKKDPEMDVKDPLMAQRWAAPGNIVPVIHPSRTGKGPAMAAEVTAVESLTTTVEMEFKYTEVKKPVKINKKITPLKKLKAPRLTSIIVDKTGMVEEAEYTLEFANEEELSEAMDMLAILREIQSANILTQSFCYPGLKSIRFNLKAPQRLQTCFVLRCTAPDAKLNKSFWESKTLFSKRVLAAGGKVLSKDYLTKALAKVMNPEETLDMSYRLGTLPEIDTYIGGYSYQGRAVPVMEIGLKSKGKLTSRRKLTTYKPTIFLLGRQHANEISSTNYGFNIAYLLAKDPGYRKYLEQLNIVVEPMENPDGSALAVELQKLTPHHMLHAGRYSALGTDIGYHVNKPDTLISEATVRKKLYDRWQPDIFLNNHGYPSHEWVQQFSNYTPYLFRAYWAPRGWYYFHSGLNTIGAPLHKQAGERIVQIISQKMKGDSEVFETNRRIYDRYRRWAERWQPHIHYLELYDGTNIYKKRRGATAGRMSQRRKMTVLEAIPEAMDETARDEWLQLSIRQGTLFVTSFFDLAMEAKKPIERIEEESGNIVHLRVVRHRPLRVEDK